MTENSSLLGQADTQNGELELIKAARQDAQAFGQLYLLYARPVYRYLYSCLGTVPEAEDATAQTFLAAFESFQRFRQDEHFAAWLFSIARHKAMDAFRRRRLTRSLDDISELPGEDDPLTVVVQSEQIAALASLIRDLPVKESELLRLRFVAELPYAEMAHLLHKKEEAVKKSVYRLLARLQSQLEGSYE